MSANRGQGLVEYGMIIGLLAVTVLAVFMLFGDSLQNMVAAAVDGETAGESRAAVSSLMYRGGGSGSITINCSGSWAMVQNNTITATVKDAGGLPLGDVPVTLQLNLISNCYIGGAAQGAGSGSSTLSTGADGTVSWNGCQERGGTGSGSATVTATVGGSEVEASQSITVHW